MIAKDGDTPSYDESFVGYGKNKIQYIHHLRYCGYTFSVLPREFLVHFPHPKSSSKIEWLHNKKLHQGVDHQYGQFKSRLAKKYGTKALEVRLCARPGKAKPKGRIRRS